MQTILAAGFVLFISGCAATEATQRNLASPTNGRDGAPGDRSRIFAPGNGVLVMHEINRDFSDGAFSHAALACCGNQGVFLLGANANPGVFESPVISAASGFDEGLLSWNIAYPSGAGGYVELRVGRAADDFWSPWLYAGDWGAHTPPDDRTMVFDGGEIEVDYFRSPQHYDRAQYRVTGLAPPGLHPPTLRRIALCLTDESARKDSRSPSPRPPRAACLPVPFRSQKTTDSALSGRLCSPASLSMVLEFRGARSETENVARLCWDPTNDIYGGWPRNIQAAFELGVPGYLTRFTDFSSAERCIAAGQPIIASIRVERPGDLRGAPYRVSDGHLLVITGFDEAGDVLVNDPAGATPADGQLTYRRDDMQRCWLEMGGVAYILLPPNDSAGQLSASKVSAK